MTVSSALNASVAGLNVHASKLASISDNISNSSTYGYKRAATEFESMVITHQSIAERYSAGGVRSHSTRLIDEEAGLVSTTNSMDLAITGRGMLPVVGSTSVSNGTSDGSMMLTRTGSFRTDASGTLTTTTGLVLLGWPAAADGTIPVMPRDSASGLQPVVINPDQKTGDPTTAITMGVNLPATATAPGASGDALPLNIEYFGNLGTSESLAVSFTPTVGTTGSSNSWTMEIRDAAQNNAVIGSYTLNFNDSRTGGGTIDTVTGTVGGAYNTTDGTIEVTTASGPIQITIGRPGDSTGLTQLSNTYSPTAVTRDGSRVGTLTDLVIDEKGFLKASYSSGATKTLYQIPIVDVPNMNGLRANGNQTYEVSADSGNLYLWNAGEGPTGVIEGYARENSATDMATELTNLIQTQRAYSSNAKVIQTVDEMLQETTNIKR